MDVDYIDHGYFVYNYSKYYIGIVNNDFFTIYSYYDYMVHMLNINGYKIIENCFHQVISENCIVLSFDDENIDMNLYLKESLKTIPFNCLYIKDIKESWILKIDTIRNEISKYSYGNHYDKDLNALIYYYLGLAENGVSLLNEILNINDAKIPLSLSLKHQIKTINDLLNPCFYSISSKAKHIYCLIDSHFIHSYHLKQLIDQSYFDVFELLYLYARMFYPSLFFDCILDEKMNDEMIQYFLKKYKIELQNICNMKKLLTRYISLPKISWIENKNML
jgi:hypothetical protein